MYCLQDGKWLFAGSGRPQGKVNEATIVKDMLPEEREYLLFLSLYDGVTSLSIGIDSLSQISGPATELPVRKKPVVFYGTSILQGGLRFPSGYGAYQYPGALAQSGMYQSGI